MARRNLASSGCSGGIPYVGHQNTYWGKAHGIKDRVMLDDTCGGGGFPARTKKQ